jgi:cytoskeleton protein RodZ
MTSQGKNTKVSQDENLDTNKVGALLQASRLRLGHDLRYVAQTLHIRYIYLEAIEAGRYQELPGAVYVAGFMRSYADFLGLDSEEVVRRSKDEIASQSVNAELVFPVPIPESSIPGGAIILVGVVILFLVYGGWYASTNNDDLLVDSISPVPEHLSSKDKNRESEAKSEAIIVEEAKELVSKEIQNASSEAQEAIETTQEVEGSETNPAPEVQTSEKIVIKPVVEESNAVSNQITAEVSPTFKKEKQEANNTEVRPVRVEAPPQKPAVEPRSKIKPALAESSESSQVSEVVEDEAPVQAEASSQNPGETAPTTENKIYGVENEDSKILVRARRNSWIQVRDNDANKLLLTQLLKTGDSYQVPNKSGLVLLTGNAGALEILVDGKPVPDLAPPGTILKNITLDPDKLRQGSAAR